MRGKEVRKISWIWIFFIKYTQVKVAKNKQKRHSEMVKFIKNVESRVNGTFCGRRREEKEREKDKNRKMLRMSKKNKTLRQLVSVI